MRHVQIYMIVAAVLAVPLAAVEASGQVQEGAVTPQRFSAQAVVVPARSIGDSVLRAQPRLAVQFQIEVQDYLPRGMEPTLVIDTIPVRGGSGIVSVQGRVTTLGFLVEDPALLRDGAVIQLQFGEDPGTRARVPGALRLQQIQPPSADAVRGLSLPTLEQWLAPARQRSG